MEAFCLTKAPPLVARATSASTTEPLDTMAVPTASSHGLLASARTNTKAAPTSVTSATATATTAMSTTVQPLLSPLLFCVNVAVGEAQIDPLFRWLLRLVSLISLPPRVTLNG